MYIYNMYFYLYTHYSKPLSHLIIAYSQPSVLKVDGLYPFDHPLLIIIIKASIKQWIIIKQKYNIVCHWPLLTAVSTS